MITGTGTVGNTIQTVLPRCNGWSPRLRIVHTRTRMSGTPRDRSPRSRNVHDPATWNLKALWTTPRNDALFSVCRLWRACNAHELANRHRVATRPSRELLDRDRVRKRRGLWRHQRDSSETGPAREPSTCRSKPTTP